MSESSAASWLEAVDARIRNRAAAKEAEMAALGIAPMRTTVGEQVGAVLALVFFWVIGLAFLAAAALVAYGAVLLMFLHAFGIELPNPANWLPLEWRQRVGA